MARILVVGATGQLGMAVVHKLLARSASVRALVRSPESAARFQQLGVQTVSGDLADAGSLARACASVDIVIATANAAVPTRRTDSFEAVDRIGYRNLIQAAVGARVRRFIYTSGALTKLYRLSPLLQCKRETETALAASDLDAVIFRTDIFMDVAFTMLGSTIPIRGSEGATVLRPFRFVSNHLKKIGNDIEQKHVMKIPGDGTARHSFICVDDVAEYLVAAISTGNAGIHTIGGPEALTLLDIAAIYERTLGIKLQVRSTPAAIFRIVAAVMRPFSPAAANLMALNYIGAVEDSFADPQAAKTFGIRLTSAEDFLRQKASLAATA